MVPLARIIALSRQRSTFQTPSKNLKRQRLYIFRRLNSYSKQHGLYHALKAFGQILKSIFILRVIDEPVLRMSIEKVLSGIEHVHATGDQEMRRRASQKSAGLSGPLVIQAV